MKPFSRPPDPQLVRMLAACHTGNERERAHAWEDLAKCLFPLVQSIAFSEQRKVWVNKHPNALIAQDAAAEAVFALYTHLGDMTDPGKVFPWLAKVVRNSLIDLARTKYMNCVFPSDELGLRESALGFGERHDEYLNLRDAIRRLSQPQREVLFYAYWLQLTAPEIAAHLGIPLEAVKARFYRARKSLLRIMNKMDRAAV